MFGVSRANAMLEFKTNFLPSAAIVGRADYVFSSHNTLMVGWDSFRAGGYAAFEAISENVVDQSFGGALRVGNDKYVELQAGYFVRNFKQHETELEGKGVSGNLILGTHFSQNFGLALFLSGKRINSGMDKRTIVDLLPFLSLRAEL